MYAKRLVAVFIGSLLAVGASSAFAYAGHQHAHAAKIPMKQAEAIALRAYPGRVTDKELEYEKGGSGLRYSFDIRNTKSRVTEEVGVDAKTGAVLENDREGPNPD